MPFRVRTADGDAVELTYSSPRPAPSTHDEARVLESLPWFEAGQPLATGCSTRPTSTTRSSRSGAAAGAPRGSARCARCSSRGRPRTRSATSTRRSGSTTTRRAAGNADLGRLQAQFDEYYAGARGQRRARQLHRGRRCPRSAPYGYLKNLVTLAGGGLVVRGGAIIHRMGLGSWQRGREVIWSKVLTALRCPIYLTIHGSGVGEPGAGRWLDSKTFVFNESRRRERGGPAADRVRARAGSGSR